jgi:signal transduction histidine kinase
VSRAIEQDEHLGLVGMRERVESLGGFFAIESKINEGTRLFARLALQNPGGSSNG